MPNSRYLEADVIVRDEEGIHERPSEAIMAISQITTHEVYISNGDKKIRPSSIYGILGLLAFQGTKLHLTVGEGPHSKQCLDMLVEAIQDPKLTEHFGEYIFIANNLRGKYNSEAIKSN